MLPFLVVIRSPPKQVYPVSVIPYMRNRGEKLFVNPTRQPTISCSFPINADLKKRLEALAFTSRISQREHLQRALRIYLNEAEQQTDKQV